ncbi:hypothetical protein DBV39_10205 [Orrella marina]|uniref:Uncharacterized protein n=1 Tax=Orrella marina TaxID=2163011 RepID=A0A2R4XJN8_9BURK|nr:hypothetical protein DBV39_10205 [Orrella marina]
MGVEGLQPTQARPTRSCPAHLIGESAATGSGFAADGGNQRASALAQAGLEQLLDDLGDKAPALVRGDSGDGNDGTLVTFEQRQ